MWHYLLDKEIAKLGYTAVPTRGSGEYANSKDSENFTPIHYRADKYELIDCGYQPYSSVKDTKETIFTKYPELADLSDTQKENVLKEYIKNGQEYWCIAHLSKSFTWAVFRCRATGEQFAVISTHMTHDNSRTVANIRRIYDAKELLAKIEAIKATYKVPAVTMGDYNFDSTETPYGTLTKGGLFDAGKTSKYKESFYTAHTMGEMPSMDGYPIDQCFYTDGIYANKLQIVVNEYTIMYSDHLPVVFDFDLK